MRNSKLITGFLAAGILMAMPVCAQELVPLSPRVGEIPQLPMIPIRIYFTNVGPSDSIHAKVCTFSSWDSTISEYVFLFGTMPSVTVQESNLSPVKNTGNGKQESQPKYSDQVLLNSSDLASLDKLLDYYRSKPRNGCNLITSIEITQFKNGVEYVKEIYQGEFCHKPSDSIWFSDLFLKSRKIK